MKTTDNNNTVGTLLTDIELENVVGGEFYKLSRFPSPDYVTFVANIGDTVEIHNICNYTVRCKIVDRKIVCRADITEYGNGQKRTDFYYDYYKVEPYENHWYFGGGWFRRCDIEK